MVTSEIHLNKKICLERLDRLSDLPEDVVDKILTNLPLRNAVRTSALSKSWRESHSWQVLLVTCSYFTRVLAVYLIPERLSFLCNLISIKVSIYFEDRNEILTALCLLGSSPRLQKIYIRSYNKKKRPHLDKEFWEGQRFRAISLPKLRSVNLEGYRGRESESGFVEFLLKNAPFLVTLDIKWRSKFQGSTRSICEGEIMQFMRSSERATITFL